MLLSLLLILTTIIFNLMSEDIQKNPSSIDQKEEASSDLKMDSSAPPKQEEAKVEHPKKTKASSKKPKPSPLDDLMTIRLVEEQVQDVLVEAISEAHTYAPKFSAKKSKIAQNILKTHDDSKVLDAHMQIVNLLGGTNKVIAFASSGMRENQFKGKDRRASVEKVVQFLKDAQYTISELQVRNENYNRYILAVKVINRLQKRKSKNAGLKIQFILAYFRR